MSFKLIFNLEKNLSLIAPPRKAPKPRLLFIIKVIRDIKDRCLNDIESFNCFDTDMS